MTIYKKQWLALQLSLVCIATQASAQTTFDPASGEITIPCVTIWDSRQVVGVYQGHRALLRDLGTGSHFALAEITLSDFDTECSGSFDTATNVYRDIVNVADQSWHIRLRRGAGNVFTVDIIAPRGAAQTSLWIARNGTNVVYLAGAVHVLRETDYPLPRAFDEAYAQSAVLYFERDLDAPGEEDIGTGDGIEALMRDPEGLTLAQQLTNATYERLRDYLCTTWDLGVEQFNEWSAQMFVSTFSFSHMERMHGVTALGVDRYFANLAEFDRLVSLWRRGDTGALNREEIAPMREADYADYALIQVQRNEAWLPRIETLLHTPETEMVVAGVAHLAGREGLVARLRQLGYHVEKY